MVHEPFDPGLEDARVEVEQEPDPFVAELQVGQELGFVNLLESLDSLDFEGSSSSTSKSKR